MFRLPNTLAFFLVSSILFICSTITVYSATIKGSVKDKVTGEGLISAVIQIRETKKHVETDLEGNYHIKHISPGTYTLTTQYLGYAGQDISVTILKEEETVVIDFNLSPDYKETKEVEIQGKIDAESDLSARRGEKNSDNTINVVSARTIELLPDITVANVAQRVPGVSLDRSPQGDGRYVIIRGMDARYNNTLINGIKIPSPNSTERTVPLDVIPAEMLERLEISKTLRPDMEGDAIGGTVNAIMKNAPDSLYLKANLSTGYSQLFFDNNFTSYSKGSIGKDPYQQNGPEYAAQPTDFSRQIFDYNSHRALPNILSGLAIGKRFFKNRLGVMVAGSYQNIYRGSTTKYNYSSIKQNTTDVPIAIEYKGRSYSTHQIRQGAILNLDYVFNEKHKITIKNSYFNLTDYEQRHTIDTIVIITGTASNNSTLDRSRTTFQTIYNSTLQGDHSLYRKILKANWSLVYSNATGGTPDWAELQTEYSNGVLTPVITFKGINHIWQKNYDKDYAGYGNLLFNPVVFGKVLEFKIGGLLRHKTRNNYYNEYQLVSDASTTFKVPPYPGIYNVPYIVYDISGTAQYGQNNYHATENILAYFAQLKIKFGKLSILGGIRMENTSQQFTIRSANPLNTTTKTVSISYSDPLPSVNLTYELTKKSNIRASFFGSISRPSLWDLVPYIQKGEYYTQAGNPHLKHTTSNNYDLSYEIFPNSKDVFRIGAFYKDINNPIESFLNIYGPQIELLTFQQAINQVNSQTLYLNTYSDWQIIPFNFGKCTNKGFEISAAKFFGSFGFSGNYTYINSLLTSIKIYNNPITHNADPILQTRPLQGQSKDLINASLLFQNNRSGVNLQLAWVYTGKRISQVGPLYGIDYYQQPFQQLDFSGDVRITKRIELFSKITNLLNSPYRIELTNGFRVQEDYYSTNYQVGIRFKI